MKIKLILFSHRKSTLCLLACLMFWGLQQANAQCSIALSSAYGTDTQDVCTNAAIANITYSTTGATGATVTGLPTGVSANWASNVLTISGTPSATGLFSYTVNAVGCTATETGYMTSYAANTISLSSATGTDAQTVCESTPITTITYATTGATGATITGLPAGVTGTWSSNVVTISGTPTTPGNYTYTVTLSGGCSISPVTGSILVKGTNSLTLSSASGTTSQTVCINTPIANITYATVSALGLTITGLPAGLTGTLASNVFTITGTPTASGSFSYTLTMTGYCGSPLSETGTITVSPDKTVTLTSSASTTAQKLCINSPITNITYATTVATNANVTGLPSGVTGSWAGGVVTISGTPTVSGTFNYTVTPTGTCGNAAATGTISVDALNRISLTSAAATNSQTVCINTAITNITYSTVSATGATITGLPAGVTGTWASNAFTISGTPTASGSFSYTITLTGGCGGVVTESGSVTVLPNKTVTLTSTPATIAQSLCINTPITDITYATSDASGAVVTGLPAGVTATWAADIVTITGTPTVAGTFSYTVTPTGACGNATATGTITVTPDNSISLTSAAGTTSQSVCINTPISSITYTTVTATGATITGLPAGITGTWASNAVTISGAPTASGSFSYTVTLTGGCGAPVTSSGTITVLPDKTVALTSAPSTTAQSLCISTPLSNITYATTNATNATVSGLPAGVSGAWAAGVVTISGTPTASGTFNYTVTPTGTCGSATATGTITVNPLTTLSLTSAASTTSQTKCINTAITNIVYATTGATGATFSGLPAGVTGAWASNKVTISGTPTASGTFSYTVTTTGGAGCGGVATATGTITVSPANTVALTSGAGTNTQAICFGDPISTITFATTGAIGVNFSGLPAGLTATWASNVATISGTPTASGIFNYTATLTGGCGNVTATGTITVNVPNTISLISAAGTASQTLCVNSQLANISYSTSGATGATFSGLPSGVSGAWASNQVIISGIPATVGTYNYTVTLTGGPGCGSVATASGTITVNPANIVGITSAAGTDAQTLCISTPITNITYSTTYATGATFSGLPAGVTGSWTSNVATITGTPTAAGTFNYTVTLTGGCGNVRATGSIVVTPKNTISLSSATGTDAQTVCINTGITPITYASVTATGATVTGLPAGVTGTWSGNVLTISGSPTATGTFNYTVTLTGGCGTTTTTGSIVVDPANTITLSSATGSNNQTRCLNVAISNITYSTTSATGVNSSGLPAGVTASMSGNTVTVSGTPTASGTFNYTLTLTGGCGSVTATGTIKVNPLPTIAVTPGTAAICIGSSISLRASGASTYVWSPAAGLSRTNGDTVTAAPNSSTTYTITGTDANGCMNATTKPVTVNSLPTITVSPATPITICEGTTTTLTANGGVSYSWSPSTGLSSTTGSLVVASPNVTTTYTVTGTNSNGCVNTASKTISVLAAPDASISPAGNIETCQDDTVYFTANNTSYASYTWLLYGGTYQSGGTSSSTIVGGLYTLRVVDAAGCAGTTSNPTAITVTLKPVPTIVLVGGHLEAIGGSFTGYQWYENNVLIPGANSANYTPTKGGSYTVEVKDNTPLHCTGKSIPYIHTGVGVNGVNGNTAIRLYPNPSYDIVHIDAAVPVNVVVNSMDGKVIYTGKEINQIDMTAFPEGVYRVLITSRSGALLKTEKITKMKSN
jgi:hypothetical protein